VSDHTLFDPKETPMPPSGPAVIDPVDAALVGPANMDAPVIPADMRAGLMTLPREQMAVVAGEYIDRRRAFRDWLKSQLVQGVHFGYPPGLEPKFDSDGNMIQKSWDKKLNEGKGGYKTTLVAPSSWTAKPSLYKAGADFICDLLVARDEYEADMNGWEQLGKPKETFVYACRLYSRANGELIGEGRGVRSVGQKGGDANNAIKMAKKSAKVDAVLNAYGLSDLFTQDTEDMPPRAAEAPPTTRDETKPKAPTRGQRREPAVTAEEMRALCKGWVAFTGLDKFDAVEFCKWTDNLLSDDPPKLNPTTPDSWPVVLRKDRYDRLMEKLP
jgi:hypothetical protein